MRMSNCFVLAEVITRTFSRGTGEASRTTRQVVRNLTHRHPLGISYNSQYTGR